MPKRWAIAHALLEFLADGVVHRDDEICASLIRRLEVDESHLPILRKTGRPKFRNEIDWVKGYLGDRGRGKQMIRQVSGKKYVILPLGLYAFRSEWFSRQRRMPRGPYVGTDIAPITEFAE